MNISYFSFSSQGEKGSKGEPGKIVSQAIKMFLLTGGSQILGVSIAMIECEGLQQPIPIHLFTARTYYHLFLCFFQKIILECLLFCIINTG